MPIAQMHCKVSVPQVHHIPLQTTFHGVVHSISTPEAQVFQYRGIKYASIPARFRQSKLFTSYKSSTDATKYGPISPQYKSRESIEEAMFGLSNDDLPKQSFKQNEFECLNLNVTAPAGLTPHSRIPVMVWIHGGADRGTGSSWVYDGGALVHRSTLIGKPIIMVTFNFRLGLFGFAAGPMLREDNKSVGDEGVGNYGLRDQRKLLEWLHHFIGDFGGDPSNITLFGESTGAADIVSHLLSTANETRPLFHRAIVQSAILEPNAPDVSAAGWHLSRLMSALHITTVDQLRAIDADKLFAYGLTLRNVDDGVFFRSGWRSYFQPDDAHHRDHHAFSELLSIHKIPKRSSRSPHPNAGLTTFHPPANLQPLIIGDCASDSLVWSLYAAQWTAPAIVRRIKAVCQSLSKSSNLMHAYDISSYTSDDEVVQRVLDLINDARVAWPTECVAQSARRDRGGHGVWRYVFDQDGPTVNLPHHAVDLVYLFDNVPLPESVRSPSSSTMTFYGDFCGFDDVDEDSDDSVVISDEDGCSWMQPCVDQWSYTRVRDTMQERWIAFAYGEAPWNDEKVFVFGPEGESGERSACIFDGRRRRQVWKEAFEPLGMQVVHKVGLELSRGPPLRGY
ncbi:alpha/beta-hydrolase [Armillaria gallica]|uniref:Carboxylic ester hydrolase n=1 Tax=Armillaria gallica TaxID=47427 RepID=A0A2H3CUX0_ARMGA|nr:alpha/beta-hydrolase [Armillaria gallica]